MRRGSVCMLLASALAACGVSRVAPTAPAATSSAEPGGDAPRASTPIADRYRDVVGTIFVAALADGGAWDKLTYLTDHVGARLSGSEALERAVAWAVGALAADGHEHVHTQKVMVPHWERGHEAAELLRPVARPLHILGLGNTVATPPEGVRGEVVVVSDLEELERVAARVAGKIVLINQVMPTDREDMFDAYDAVARARVRGPSAAARHGATAVLVRSLTTRSLRTPHTGTLVYDPAAPRIPAAAVSTEDADLLARLAAAGEPVELRLVLGARSLPDKESANVIAELRGRERPEEIVLIGAHIDSWDVGQGAHDDGAGCVMVMQALTVLRRLGLRPRRTIRVVLFTNEENGTRGARAYLDERAGELASHVMAFESDTGGYAPLGFTLDGNERALEQLRDIVTLLQPIGAARVRPGFSGVDIAGLARAGVPSLGLWVESAAYFDIHHTHADTLDKVDPGELARNVAAVAVLAYVVADMPERLGQ